MNIPPESSFCHPDETEDSAGLLPSWQEIFYLSGERDGAPLRHNPLVVSPLADRLQKEDQGCQVEGVEPKMVGEPSWVTHEGSVTKEVCGDPGGWSQGDQYLPRGLPWWLRDQESACQCRRHRFDPCSRKMPHGAKQLNPCTFTTRPVLHKRSHRN